MYSFMNVEARNQSLSSMVLNLVAFIKVCEIILNSMMLQNLLIKCQIKFVNAEFTDVFKSYIIPAILSNDKIHINVTVFFFILKNKNHAACIDVEY